jgi:long-chain acyl-CoA synthetase
MTGFRVADVVRGHAQSRPTDDAVVVGARAITYGELDERSSRLAQLLLASGARAGARIGLLETNSAEAVELLFACSKSAMVLVPINWRLAEPEIAAVLDDARIELLVAGPAFAASAERLVAASSHVRTLLLVGEGGERDYERALSAHPADDPDAAGSTDDVVLQLYTSGTTGVAKGVLTTHRNLENAVRDTAEPWGVDEDSVCLAAMPLFHIGGIGWLFLGLYHGTRNIVVPTIDAARMLDTIEAERVTNAFFVPTLLQMLMAVPGVDQRDFSALRSIAYGASPITTSVLRAATTTFGCPLFQLYGLTETTGAITQLDAADHDVDGPRQHLLRSAGRPYPWVELRIVEQASGRTLAPHEIGEIWVRSVTNTPGYFERPAETGALLTDDGWVRTGDGGYLDEDGYLFLTDRIKDMIVSGAENVYPIEVEEALSQHPGVAEVAVIGVPHERWGETVKALVVPAPGQQPSAEELVAFARERLASYKLPRSIDLLDELPKTPTGKVLKRELRQRYADDA